MEQLEQKLKEINFEFDSKLFGQTVLMNANENKNFLVPFSKAWKTLPGFELVDSKGKTPDPSKFIDGKKPTRTPKPLIIRTYGLTPLNFQLDWKKDRKSTGGQRPVLTAK